MRVVRLFRAGVMVLLLCVVLPVDVRPLLKARTLPRWRVCPSLPFYSRSTSALGVPGISCVEGTLVSWRTESPAVVNPFRKLEEDEKRTVLHRLQQSPRVRATVAPVVNRRAAPTPADATMVSGADPALFAKFTELAVTNIEREFPYAPAHVWNGPDDSGAPKDYHPAFYGCFDWHSAVHSHWLLVRVLRCHDDKISNALSETARSLLNRQFDCDKLLAEAEYCARNGYFERTYGWAWVLKLAEEIHLFVKQGDRDAKQWQMAMAPLVHVIEKHYTDFLPVQARPIRSTTHQNTAFGISMALDYARTVGQANLEKLLCETAVRYFGGDEGYGAMSRFEPGGNDFFSAPLTAAELMSKVLLSPASVSPAVGPPPPPPRAAFSEWFSRNFPGKPEDYSNLLRPYPPPPDADGQIVHVVGLNFSRAWCMSAVSDALPEEDPGTSGGGGWAHQLRRSALAHMKASWGAVASGDYMAEHWLGTFAVYAFDARCRR